MQSRHVKCNLCGADEYTVVFPRGFAQLHQIVRCNHCDLMYADPQETIDCERFASDDHPKVFDVEASRQYFQKQHVQLPDYERALRALDELLPQRGKLLEIGSYVGVLLNHMRADGWDVTGLEPDQGVADYSRAKYGLNVIAGVLPQPALGDHAYDAVVMLHVIEHMPDPAANLREIHRILRPGGVLVAETPRFDSLMFKILGRHERSICNCDGHIFFFTVPTLTRLLKKNGFEVVRVDLVGRTLTVDRFLTNVGLIAGNLRIRKWLSAFSAAFHLDKAHIHVNVKDMQRAFVRAV
jgi:2-polyprenyl-3-methyl-5-hydroxy-6-metoxy-1,4-benzoquinol methylase